MGELMRLGSCCVEMSESVRSQGLLRPAQCSSHQGQTQVMSSGGGQKGQRFAGDCSDL